MLLDRSICGAYMFSNDATPKTIAAIPHTRKDTGAESDIYCTDAHIAYPPSMFRSSHRCPNHPHTTMPRYMKAVINTTLTSLVAMKATMARTTNPPVNTRSIERNML